MDFDSFSGADGSVLIPAVAQENFEERTPCVLLVDCSKSMEGDPIDQVNKGVVQLQQELARDPLVAARVTLCVIAVGGNGPNEVQIVTDWTDANDFVAPAPFVAGGTTPLGAGITLAMCEIERVKQGFRQTGVSFKRPLIIGLTDGRPTDDFRKAAIQCAQAVRDRKLLLWMLATEDADCEALAHFGGQVFDVADADLRQVFQFVSYSLAGMSRSNAGDELQLPTPQQFFTSGV
jgi:uncharacterized protein YegL